MSQKYKIVGDYIYNPSHVLGNGTWGTVFKAKHKEHNTHEYALKKMNKFKIEASQKSFEKYQSEVMALQKACQIPQIMKIIDFFKSKSNYYIVTQYYDESKDLFDYMIANKNKFSEIQSRGIWKDLLIGIYELHKIGIYHRDIKLQNIVYLPDQRKSKIIDFGMATCFPKPDGIVGSPMFMSPQVLNNQQYSQKCDIWSLGIIFYCMIFRTSPYGDLTNPKDIFEKMKKIKQQGLEFPEEFYISKSCKQVIESCLQFNQKDRSDIEDILKLKFFEKKEIPEGSLEYYEPCTTFHH